jgi:hypothetical protein
MEGPVSCDEAAERLPWLIGGGLDAREAEDVRAHVAGCPACQAALDETRRAASVFDAHLPASVLVDLAWDRPAPAPHAPDVVDRHLSSCAQCAEELALLRQSRELERASDLARPAAPAPARSRVSRFAGWGGALAAGLVLGLGVSTLRRADPPAVSPTPDAGVQAELRTLRESNAALQAQLEGAAAPQVNVPVVELFPGDQARRSTSAPGQDVVVPSGARVVALLLSAEGADDRVASVELREAGGRTVWSGSGLRAGPLGAYTLVVPSRLLPEGRYTIVVQPQGRPGLLYPVRVRHSRE